MGDWRGWRLYLSILGGAVVLGFLLTSLPPGVVIVIALAAVAFVSIRYERGAKAAKEDVTAFGLGFERSATDPFSLWSLPLALLSRGSDQTIADVMWGKWGDVDDVKLFSFGYTDASSVRRTYACVLADSPTEEAFAVVVEPKTFLIPEPDRAPMPLVTIDDATFAEGFEIRSDDPRKAAAVLTEGLRDRVRSLQDRWGFELRGRMLLCYSPVAGIEPTESLRTISVLRRALAEPEAPASDDGPETLPQAGPPQA
jgi:hypothetical protein